MNYMKNNENSRKNVVILSEEYPQETLFGGIGTYNKDLSTLLSTNGFFVYVICKTYKKSHICRDGHNTIVIRVNPIFSRISALEKLLGWRYSCYQTLKKLSKKRTISVVETPEWNADLLLGFIFGNIPPTIVRLHGCRGIIRKYDNNRTTIIDRLIMCFEKFILVRSKYLSSISKSCMEETEKVYGIDIKNKTRVIPNFSSPPQEYKEIIMSTPKIVLFAGRVESWKGVFNLCRAINIVNNSISSDVVFIFAGRDIMIKSEGCTSTEKCKEILGDNISKCNFLGQVSKEKLELLYSKAYVTVLPSLYEPFGLCCIEAMKNGSPVIAGRNGGMSEIITDGKDGLLVDPTNPNDISDKLLKILNNTILRNKMSIEAKNKYISNYSIDVISNEYKSFYNLIIQEK